MENLEIYNAFAEVPAEAKREIKGGRMAGKTDINPMWRLKALTEQFGPCGIGWSYEITKQWLEPGAKGEISAFCNILLYVKIGEEWSKGIPGTGGSAFVASEKGGLYTSDECYKMALTDAISVACKALGVAANVYWDKDPTKYDRREDNLQKSTKPAQSKYIGKVDQASLQCEILRTGGNLGKWIEYLATKFAKEPPKSIAEVTPAQYEWSMKVLEKKPTKTVTAHDDTI